MEKKNNNTVLWIVIGIVIVVAILFATGVLGGSVSDDGTDVDVEVNEPDIDTSDLEIEEPEVDTSDLEVE